MSETKERPILFSGPMVRALLAGTKTQTRRVIKAARADWVRLYPVPFPGADVRLHYAWDGNVGDSLRCPYGQPGDRLWVRESFDFLPSGGPDEPQVCEIVYWATGSHEKRIAPFDYNPMIYGHEKVRPSIHMPRWASRITLEITAVRVERLQDISEADAIAEGIERADDFFGCPCWKCYGEDADVVAPDDPIGSYRSLWESINGPGSWDANPWVWVVEFKKVG